MTAQEQRPVWGATGTCDDSPIPPGTTWNAWTPLSRRCPWTSGSVQNVRGQRQLLQQVRLSLGRVPSCCHCPTQPLCPSLLPCLADSGSGSEDLSLLLADVVPTSSRLRPRLGRTRAIARTRQSERVRATVNRNRLSTARSSPVGARAGRWGCRPALWGRPEVMPCAYQLLPLNAPSSCLAACPTAPHVPAG